MRSHRVWLFDLDNTLHDANPHIFPAISRSMCRYVAQEIGVDETAARQLRDHYWHRYGATLTGLIRHHGVDPHHFLAATHAFLDDLPRMLVHEPALRHVLKRLPGRKIVFSNAPRRYVEAVLEQIGILPLIDGIWSIERLRFTPKPHADAFRRLLCRERLDAHRCILVEDTPANLRAAKRLGMTTILVSRAQQVPAYVDWRIKSVLELPKLGLSR
ncbi:pyrimidine 5'-nucleotidase [Sulfuricystis multivorans]|uniref:pyrimidine 5'-nucleotidase n=1 Tax=Sulfuricystis multivorans TaxID=2211108 RepID=UPI000F842215|nr:pyrimidine 5'-nucleotidase [Sulfuricystis multivorans]